MILEKITEKGFTPYKLKSLIYKYRKREKITDDEWNRVEKDCIIVESKFKPEWVNIDGMKKVKYNEYDPMPSGSKLVYLVWGSQCDYSVYVPQECNVPERSDRVSFQLIYVVGQNFSNEHILKFWTPEAIEVAKDLCDKMKEIKTPELVWGFVYTSDGKYYKNVHIDGGVDMTEIPGLARVSFWGHPLIEASQDDPQVMEAISKKRDRDTKDEKIKKLREETISKLREIDPELFQGLPDQSEDSEDSDMNIHRKFFDERYINMIAISKAFYGGGRGEWF
jgi:hypothetical protein